MYSGFPKVPVLIPERANTHSGNENDGCVTIAKSKKTIVRESSSSSIGDLMNSHCLPATGLISQSLYLIYQA